MLMLVILFVLLFALGVPVAIAIGVASFPIVIEGGMPLTYVFQRLFAAIDSFPLMAIPFFVLAGTLMEGGGISKRLVGLANACVGHRYGGLAIVTILASMFFAAVSGSGSATTAAIGSIMIPAMVAKKYDTRFATATTATAAQIGVIIPPSIPMVLYCVGTGASIGTLFVAGFLPGIMIGISLMIYANKVARKRGYVGETRCTGKEKFIAFKEAIWALLMPVIILGGIYSGLFTPTESAAIACVYAIIVGLFVYREMTLKNLYRILLKSAISSAAIMLIISSAGLFSSVLTYERVPQLVANFFVSLGGNKYIFLLLVNILLFFVGMFIDGGPAMIILAPILGPVAVSLGIDPIHFGIVMVCNNALGQITPPFGTNLFVASQVAKIRLEDMIKDIIPYVAIVFADVLILTYIPAISTFLPKLLGMM